MTRINAIEPSVAEKKSAELLASVKRQLGATPNLFKVLAHSPAALDFYTSQTRALAGGSLDPKLREQIALTVAGVNQCDYCASAHTFLGKKAGIPEHDLTDNLTGYATDDKTNVALRFAKTVVENRGRIDDHALQTIRDAGFSEANIVEIIAHIGMNLFTNYLNHIAGTDIDFPKVETSKKSSAA
jgi:uncharacterized peroxidase-related enzyme